MLYCKLSMKKRLNVVKLLSVTIFELAFLSNPIFWFRISYTDAFNSRLSFLRNLRLTHASHFTAFTSLPNTSVFCLKLSDAFVEISNFFGSFFQNSKYDELVKYFVLTSGRNDDFPIV